MTCTFDLRRHLDDLIRLNGPIPFSQYMEVALYHPEFGYYSLDRNPIGLTGDFYTSSSIDSAMGELLARLFSEMATDIEGFALIELGAGSGVLARHILEAQRFPYSILERSRAMRQRQKQTLDGLDVTWLESLPDHFRGCVFSNEFFDALPVRRFVRRAGRIREIFVGEGLVEIEGEANPPIDLPLLEEGAIADLAPEATLWMQRIGAALQHGYHLAIDYGYMREDFFSRTRGTLMCYRNHQVDEDPYSDPGEKDLTAHVNFSDLIDAGAAAGLIEVGYRSQKDFLIELGLLEIMTGLAESGTASSLGRLQWLKNLILPQAMGERFRVLLQRKGLPEKKLTGFREAGYGTGSEALTPTRLS